MAVARSSSGSRLHLCSLAASLWLSACGLGDGDSLASYTVLWAGSRSLSGDTELLSYTVGGAGTGEVLARNPGSILGVSTSSGRIYGWAVNTLYSIDASGQDLEAYGETSAFARIDSFGFADDPVEGPRFAWAQDESGSGRSYRAVLQYADRSRPSGALSLGYPGPYSPAMVRPLPSRTAFAVIHELSGGGSNLVVATYETLEWNVTSDQVFAEEERLWRYIEGSADGRTLWALRALPDSESTDLVAIDLDSGELEVRLPAERVAFARLLEVGGELWAWGTVDGEPGLWTLGRTGDAPELLHPARLDPRAFEVHADGTAITWMETDRYGQHELRLARIGHEDDSVVLNELDNYNYGEMTPRFAY